MSLEELRPVGKQRIGELVYRELLEAIVNGVLKPGARLAENDVAQRLKVSATPVREALRALERDELVTRRPYHSSYVRVFRAEEIRELYEARVALERMAIRLATERIQKEDLEALDRNQREGQSLLEDGDFEGYVAYNARFHAIVLKAAGNRTLARLMETIAHKVRLLATVTIGVQGQPRRAVVEHGEMIQAMRERDADRAMSIMEDHIARAADLVVVEYERYLNEAPPAPASGQELTDWAPRWLGDNT